MNVLFCKRKRTKDAKEGPIAHQTVINSTEFETNCFELKLSALNVQPQKSKNVHERLL